MGTNRQTIIERRANIDIAVRFADRAIAASTSTDTGKTVTALLKRAKRVLDQAHTAALVEYEAEIGASL